MNPHDMPLLPPGTRIGGNVVEGVLGRGSFATVYRVRGPEGSVSALKLVPLEEGSVRAERALREVSLGTRLHHPNLVCHLGWGHWPADNPRFLWMKLRLVLGPTLEQWGQASGRTVGEVVDKALEVARGLAVAHEERVVHRDVKGDNILVDARTGQAVLVDFGAGYHEGDATLTKGVFPKGAHLYRAPETWAFLRQHAGVEGAHFRAGPSGDLYALGVVLYQLLTGRAPFRLDDEGGVDVEAVLHEAPLPPHLVNPRVPLALEAVCLRLLAKTPEQRYPSAVALYEALEEAKARADATWTVPLHGGTPPAASKPWTRGARVLVGLGVGLALALGAWWLTSRIENSISARPGNTLTTIKAHSYRSDTERVEGGSKRVRLAVVQELRNAGSAPWTLAGAVLVGPRGEEWKALAVWPLKPIPPGQTGHVVVEVEATEAQARGTFILKLWSQEGGARGELFDGVTFP